MPDVLLQQTSSVLSPSSLPGTPPLQAASILQLLCHAERRTNPAFHMKHSPASAPAAVHMQQLLCCSQNAVVLIQRLDPGVWSAKGSWDFFKMPAPVCWGWPLWVDGAQNLLPPASSCFLFLSFSFFFFPKKVLTFSPLPCFSSAFLSHSSCGGRAVFNSFFLAAISGFETS